MRNPPPVKSGAPATRAGAYAGKFAHKKWTANAARQLTEKQPLFKGQKRELCMAGPLLSHGARDREGDLGLSTWRGSQKVRRGSLYSQSLPCVKGGGPPYGGGRIVVGLDSRKTGGFSRQPLSLGLRPIQLPLHRGAGMVSTGHSKPSPRGEGGEATGRDG